MGNPSEPSRERLPAMRASSNTMGENFSDIIKSPNIMKNNSECKNVSAKSFL